MRARRAGLQLRGLIGQLDALCQTLSELEVQIETVFAAHPDAEIVTSFPAVGIAVGARILAAIGDDHQRFADGRALKAFAGAAPITRASGRSHVTQARRAKNDRLAAAGYAWALTTPTTPSPAPRPTPNPPPLDTHGW